MRGCHDTVDRDVTIGVNLVSTAVDVDWLVLIDRPDSFGPMLPDLVTGRHQHAVVTNCYDPHWRHHIPDAWSALAIPLGGAMVPEPWDHIPYGWMSVNNGSTYAALSLASYFGCTTIYLGGADYTQSHKWGDDAMLLKADVGYMALRYRIEAEGGHVYNASSLSRLKAFDPCPSTTTSA